MTVEVSLFTVGHCRQREWFATGRRTGKWITFPALVAHIRHPSAGLILFDTGYGPALQTASSFGAERIAGSSHSSSRTIGVSPGSLAASIPSSFRIFIPTISGDFARFPAFG